MRRHARTWQVTVALVLLLSNVVWNAQAAPPAPENASPPHMALGEAPSLEAGAAAPTPPGLDSLPIPVPASKLVFQSYRDNNWEIYTALSDGSGQTRLTVHNAADIHPRFDRGCARIVFSSKRSGNYDIWTMNWDGSGLVRLTTVNNDDVFPVWSPDGTRIAFTSYRDGQTEVYVMNADGSGQTRLTWDAAYDGQPAWSPDGSKIAFASYRGSIWRIWVMNADGSNPVQVSAQPYSESPTWSPDGSKIAFDADTDGDTWQELWLMNADGSNQHMILDAGVSQDSLWAYSWSPDGRYVAFTHIYFINYGGTWYWLSAFAKAADITVPWSEYFIVDTGTEWNPDWQSTDLWPPESHVLPLAAQSPSPFTVSWTGSDVGDSGLRNYDLQVSTDGGPWTDWLLATTATSASYEGIGGHTYAFRSRARDYASNVEPWPDVGDASTVVEARAPQTAVGALPAYFRGTTITVRWSGQDFGGSGIALYEVQYNDESVGFWSDWLTSTVAGSAPFSGMAGHTYSFRSRARDNAWNEEAWPLVPDATTTLYTWAIHGTVSDTRDDLLAGVAVTTTPAAFESAPSDDQGAFAAYVANIALTYAAEWGKAGYGGLPATDFPGAEDAQIDVVLPPADDVVRDGGFESGSLPPNWAASGDITPVVTTTLYHTGDSAALLGCVPGPLPPVSVSNSSARSQQADMAVGPDGTVHVIWSEGPDYGMDIYYAQHPRGGTWSSPLNLTNTGLGAADPQLAVGSDGLVHAVWSGPGTSGPAVIFYSLRALDGSWTPPLRISDETQDYLQPQLARDPLGNIHVVWGDTWSPTMVYYAHRTSGGSWSPPIQLSISGDGAFSPWVKTDLQGGAHVVWTEFVMGYYTIVYAYRTPAGNWSAPEVVSGLPGAYMPQFAVDESGIVHLVWQQSLTTTESAFYARRDTDGTWSSPENISGDVMGVAPQVGADGSGAVHVAFWNGWSSGVSQVFYTRRSIAGDWSVPANISHSTAGAQDPQLAAEANGTVYVAWLDIGAGLFEVWYARLGGGAWFGPWKASSSSNPSESQQVVVEEGRSGHLLWVDSGWPNKEIYYAGETVSPLTGDSVLAQTVTVPLSPTAPTLSFLYLLDGVSSAAGSWFSVQASSGLTPTTLFSTTEATAGWTHRWLDMTSWASQSITLTFRAHMVSGYRCAAAHLDEVSLGSAYPDLYVQKEGPRLVRPGDMLVYTLAYGNRGGVAAAGVVVTDTLPAGVTFVAADPPISPTLPLRWDVGSLDAGSGPFYIVVTASLTTSATFGSTLTNTVQVGGPAELEAANNVARSTAFVGYRIYLPILFK